VSLGTRLQNSINGGETQIYQEQKEFTLANRARSLLTLFHHKGKEFIFSLQIHMVKWGIISNFGPCSTKMAVLDNFFCKATPVSLQGLICRDSFAGY